MSRRKTKTENQKRHAKRRALQRFGIELTDEKRQNILNQINSGKSRLVRRQSHRVAIHEVTLDGVLIHVVYDKHRKEVVTLLPPEWTDEH